MTRDRIPDIPTMARLFFNNRCYICQKKYGRYFVFHHHTYKGKSYRDFNGNKRAYHKYLAREIWNDMNNFTLLCRKHHLAVETMKKFKPDRFERLVRVVEASR